MLMMLMNTLTTRATPPRSIFRSRRGSSADVDRREGARRRRRHRDARAVACAATCETEIARANPDRTARRTSREVAVAVVAFSSPLLDRRDASSSPLSNARRRHPAAAREVLRALSRRRAPILLRVAASRADVTSERARGISSQIRAEERPRPPWLRRRDVLRGAVAQVQRVRGPTPLRRGGAVARRGDRSRGLRGVHGGGAQPQLRDVREAVSIGDGARAALEAHGALGVRGQDERDVASGGHGAGR